MRKSALSERHEDADPVRLQQSTNSGWIQRLQATVLKRELHVRRVDNDVTLVMMLPKRGREEAWMPKTKWELKKGSEAMNA